MPKAEPCECDNCRRWRERNLPYGSMHHTNLTKEVIDALSKQNEPRGARKERKNNRPKINKKY